MKNTHDYAQNLRLKDSSKDFCSRYHVNLSCSTTPRIAFGKSRSHLTPHSVTRLGSSDLVSHCYKPTAPQLCPLCSAFIMATTVEINDAIFCQHLKEVVCLTFHSICLLGLIPSSAMIALTTGGRRTMRFLGYGTF